MWAVIPFMKFISDPLLAGRVFSALCGLFTTIGIGVAGYILFSNFRLALSASLLWAVIPYAVFFDRMALADGLLAMFMVWTFVFSVLSLRYLRWDLSMLAGFTLGFAWLTKSPAIFAMVLIPAGLLLVEWKHLRGIRKVVPLILIGTTFIIGFAMYNILRLGPEFHQIALRNRDYVFPLSEVISHPTDPLIPHLRDAIGFYLYLVTPLGLGFALLGIAEGGLRHWRQRLILLLWWLVPVISQSFVAKAFTARYLLFTVPFSLILASHGLWHFGDRTQKHFLSLTGLILVVCLSLGYDYLLLTDPQKAPLPRIERSGYMEEWTAGYGLKEAAGQIRSSAASGPVVIGSEGYFGTPFSAMQMYLNDVSNVRIVGLGTVLGYPDPKLTSARAENQIFVVFNSTRIPRDPADLGYEILGSYPKAVRPDGSREYLLLMKLK